MVKVPTRDIAWMREQVLGVCEVIGCSAILGGPRDTSTMCAECAQQIEEQERESAEGDEQ